MAPTERTVEQSVERLILGTRGSKLALTQSGQVAAEITRRTGVPVELRVITTRGDRIQDRPLPEVGGKGLFTAELEAGLQDGSIDLAVHSLKDLPTENPPGLCIAAFPERADPRDVLIGGPLAALPLGARVGTGSLRRELQLRALRPDAAIAGIRGNVDTRLAKKDDGSYDAVILALAGLGRLGIARHDLHPFSLEEMVPAVGQGVLAVQARADDPTVLALLSQIDHAQTRRCALEERAFLAAFGGGCHVPVAAYAWFEGAGRLRMVAVGPGADGALQRVTLDQGLGESETSESEVGESEVGALGVALARRLRAQSPAQASSQEAGQDSA